MRQQFVAQFDQFEFMDGGGFNLIMLSGVNKRGCHSFAGRPLSGLDNVRSGLADLFRRFIPRWFEFAVVQIRVGSRLLSHAHNVWQNMTHVVF